MSESASDLTSHERAVYQAMRARGYEHEDALSDALDGVNIEDVRSPRALGFTGTRSIDDFRDGLFWYLERVETKLWLHHFGMFVTGGCRGWDGFIGRYLADLYPTRRHRVYVPSNRSQVDPWWNEDKYADLRTLQVVYMEDGTDYRDRNAEIVNASNEVFYCAEHPEDDTRSKRSGTWMTVRIARNRGVLVNGIILNRGDT